MNQNLDERTLLERITQKAGDARRAISAEIAENKIETFAALIAIVAIIVSLYANHLSSGAGDSADKSNNLAKTAIAQSDIASTLSHEGNELARQANAFAGTAIAQSDTANNYSGTAIAQSDTANAFAGTAIAQSNTANDYSGTAIAQSDTAIDYAATAIAQSAKANQTSEQALLTAQIINGADIRGKYYVGDSPDFTAASDIEWMEQYKLSGRAIDTTYQRVAQQHHEQGANAQYLFLLVSNEGLGGAQNIRLSSLEWVPKAGETVPAGIMTADPLTPDTLTPGALKSYEFYALLIDSWEKTPDQIEYTIEDAHFSFFSLLVEYTDARGSHEFQIIESEAIRKQAAMQETISFKEFGQQLQGGLWSSELTANWEWTSAPLYFKPTATGQIGSEFTYLLTQWSTPIQLGVSPVYILTPIESFKPLDLDLSEQSPEWLVPEHLFEMSFPTYYEWDMSVTTEVPSFILNGEFQLESTIQLTP